MKNNISFKEKILIPKEIKCEILKKLLIINGKLGLLNIKISNFLNIELYDNYIYIYNIKNNNFRKNIKSIVYTTISLINNIFIGVTKGYSKRLLLFGIGYKVELCNNYLKLFLGFSHNIIYNIPNNIIIKCNSNTDIIINGINKQLVGQVAADIRKFKVPDSYKGKGIRYFNEKLIIKEYKKTK